MIDNDPSYMNRFDFAKFVDENKRNDKLEKILLSELDITQSPIKRKPNINVNVFTTFFSFLLRKTMWLICIR